MVCRTIELHETCSCMRHVVEVGTLSWKSVSRAYWAIVMGVWKTNAKRNGDNGGQDLEVSEEKKRLRKDWTRAIPVIF